MITIVASMTQDRVIGHKGKIPWAIPADLARYRMLTTESTVVMGRKTYGYLQSKKPELLSNHENVVLSHSRIPVEPNVHWAASPREVLDNYDRFFVIGGEQTFKVFLPYASHIYLSLVHGKFDGDAFFPEFETEFWLKSKEFHSDHDFQVFCREGI